MVYMKIAILIFLFSSLIFSQNQMSYDEIGHNNFGKEFYLTIPPNLSRVNQSQNEHINFIFFSPFDANVSIEVLGKGYKRELFVKANVSNGFKININTVQPFIKTGIDYVHYDLVFKNSAIVIKSDYPVSVVVLSNFDNTADSYLAIPIENLGNEYVVANFNDARDRYEGYNSLTSNATIVATEDNTNVEFFYPAENYPYDVRGPKLSGSTFKKTLNKGDVWLMSGYFANDDLSNARVKSDKPIAVISSNQCANIPINNNWCDFIMNMELPVKYWGMAYIISKYSYKRFSPVIRVYAAENNTQIFINGILYYEIDDVYSQTKKSYIEIQRPLENNFQPFIVSSNKPIMVTSYNTGDEEDLKAEPNGGPSMMSLPSIESMTNYISVSSPNFPEDISFNSNYVNLLIELDDSNDIPNSLEIGSVIGNELRWTKVKNHQNIISSQKINAPYHNKIYGVIVFKLAHNGHFKFRSDYKFTAINYGTTEFKSYGFASNYNLILNSGLDSIPPIIDWSVNCQSQIIGTILENNLKGNLLIPDSNLTNMRVLDRTQNPAHFIIDIIDKTKGASGTIRVWDAYGNITNQKVYYKPQDISIEPNRLILNSKTNERVSETFIIKNNSDESFELKKLYSNFDYLEFYFNGIEVNSQTITIPSKSELRFNVSLNSPVDTIFNARVFVSDECLERELARINVNVSSPIIEVTDVNFDDLIVGQESLKEFRIYNRGKVPLTIEGIINPNLFNFSVIGLPLITKSTPFIINPNSYYTGFIKILSNKTGLLFDSLKIRSDADIFDSVCYITANLLEPGFIVNSFDFGRKLVSSIDYDLISYKSDTLMIANYSEIPIKIKDLKFVDEKNSNAFIIDKNKFIDQILLPNQEYKFVLEFKPEVLGHHNLNVIFELYDDIPNYSILSLKGFGTRPKLIFNDTLDFGKVQVNTIKNDKIEILNERNNWEYNEILNNFNIVYDEIKAVSNGFSFSSLSSSEIRPNEKLPLNISFKPSDIGVKVLEVRISGNFESKNVFYIKGEGIDSKLNIIATNLTALACENEKDTIFVVIENNGNNSIIFDPIYFEPIIPEFSFLDSKFTSSEFEINSKSKIIIPIEFISLGSNKLTNLNIKEKQKIVPNVIEIQGHNKLYDNEFELKPLSQQVEVNKPALTSVLIENNPELKDANITDLSLIVSYNPNMMKLQDKSIRLSNKLNSKYVIDNITHLETGKVRFDLIPLTDEVLSEGGEIVSFVFNTFLPNELENTSKVNIDLIAKTSQCVNFKTYNEQTIEMLLNCGDEFRKVSSDIVPFHIDNINPNPLDRTIDLTYSTPFDANVNISLVNLNGVVMKVFVNEYKQRGFYEFNLNIDNLSSGQYFLRVNAGQFSENIPIIIKK